ncbi:MAG: hypothetical protein RLZ75_1564, partial [Pseudomonadota bacterium]
MSGFKYLLSPVIKLSGVIIVTVLISGCQHMVFFPDFGENISLFEEDKQQNIQSKKTEAIEAHEFQLAENQTMVGKLAIINTRENDTLSDIARHFGLGYNDMSVANPTIAPWTPQAGSRVVLPL